MGIFLYGDVVEVGDGERGVVVKLVLGCGLNCRKEEMEDEYILYSKCSVSIFHKFLYLAERISQNLQNIISNVMPYF